MSLDEILKNVRGVASSAYNAYKQGQTPAQWITPKIVNPIADAIKGTVSPVPTTNPWQIGRNIASETVREFGNSIPDIGTSMLRLSPPGQLYESGKIIPKLDIKNPLAQSNLQKIQDYQNVLRKQQIGDLYNATKGIGYIAGGLGASAPATLSAKALLGKAGQTLIGGGVNSLINAGVNVWNGKNPLDNVDKAFAQGATTAGQMGLVNEGVAAAFPRLSMKATVNPVMKDMYNKVNKFKTVLPSLERIAGKTVTGGIEGAALGAMQPLEEGQSRLSAITQNAAMGAGMSLLGQTGSEVKMQTLGKMKQTLMMRHGMPETEANKSIRNFFLNEGKRILNQQFTASPDEPFYYKELREALGKPANGDYIPSPGMTVRPLTAEQHAAATKKLPLTEAVQSSETDGNEQGGTPLPLNKKTTQLSEILKPNVDADNAVRDAIASGDLAGAKQLHADLSVDTKMTPFDQLQTEASGTQAKMMTQAKKDMGGQYGEYESIVARMKSFLGMAGEKTSKASGELFREHIPRKVFGVSSDEVATSLGKTESEFMQELMDGLRTSGGGARSSKLSLDIKKVIANKDALKLDPEFFTIIKNWDDSLRSVSAEATPKVLANQAKAVEAARIKTAKAQDKEWRKYLAEKYKLQTPAQKTNEQIKKITGAIKENTNDGLPPIADDMPTHKRNKWDSVRDFGKSLALTSRKVLSDMGTYGKEAAKRIDEYSSKYRKMAGGAVADYQQETRGLDAKGIENVNRFLDGQNVTLSSQEAKAATAMRAKLDEFGGLASQAQLTIETRDGRKVPFSMRENYLPHMVDEVKLKANRDIAVDYFATTGQMPKTTAAQFVDDIIAGAEVGDTYRKYFPNVLPKKYGNLETARLIDWSPEVLRYDKKLLPDYFEGAGKRIQGALTFGSNNEIVNKLLNGISREGGNASLAEDILGRNLGYKQDPQYIRQASGAIRQVQGAMKLGLSAISNASQTVNTATTFGIRRTLKNIIPSIVNPTKKEFAERTGTILEQTMKDMQDEVSGTGPLAKVTAPGFGFVERLNRTIAANTGKDFAVDMFAKLQKNPTSSSLIRSLEKMGIDVTAALKQGKLSPEDLVTAGQKGVDLTQFKVDPIDQPPLWASSGAKILTQFKNFAYQQGKFVVNEIGKEATKGNFAPLARYLLLGTIVGEGFADIKAFIRGKERPTGAKRVLDNIMQVGGIGIISDAVNAIDGGAERMYSFITGPTVSDVVTTGKNIGGAIKGKPLPLEKQAVNAIPIVGGPIANRLFPSTAATPTKDKIQEKTGGTTSFLSDKTDYSTMDQAAIDEQLKNIKEQKDKIIENKGILGIGKLSEAQIEEKVKVLDQEAEQLKSTGAFTKIKEVEALPSATTYDALVKRDKGFGLLDDITKMPKELQAGALQRLGISQNEADYYTVAKGNEDQRYEFIKDKATSVEKILPFLITVNGKSIATSGILTKLYDDGVISKAERTYLNALEWDEKTQKFKTSRAYQVSQSGASSAKTKARLKDLFDMSQTVMKAQVALAEPSQKALPSYSRTLESVLKARSPSTTGLDSVLSMYKKTADQVHHLK